MASRWLERHNEAPAEGGGLLQPVEARAVVLVEDAPHLALAPALTLAVLKVGTVISLQHRKLHDGCPLIPRRFSGTAALHPDALV